jgi:glycerol-3-phosphate dehydrogenase (NAD(P)+)
MDSHHQSPITILGAGSWGTALALHLAKQGQAVQLWTPDVAKAAEMSAARANPSYLPDYPFPDTLQVTSNLAEAVSSKNEILIATPSAAFREVLLAIKPFISATTRIAWATKGLDLETGQFLHEIAQDLLGTARAYAVLSGPSFAREVAAGLPTAVIIASHNTAFAEDLRTRFNSQMFRVYSSADVVGVEMGGIVKNVLAIAAGISDGMQLGANARSALITRGLAEMIRLGVAVGAQYETLTGLAGLGDLVLTCTDNQSRNRRFGLALGQGKTVAEAAREIGQVIEGKRNAELVVSLAKKHHVEMPISETVMKILHGEITVREAMQLLLSRAPKNE